jgi:asparagine synthase (glutamine-hydrolysing)
VMKNYGGIEKGILRTAVTDLLPPAVVQRRKSGYPSAQTAGYRRAQNAAAHELLCERDAPIWEIADRSTVAAILAADDHADWTALNRIAYLLETNSWLVNLGVRLE